MSTPNPLTLASTSPTTLLALLAASPALAHTRDATGYTLLHAATSYNQLPLLTALLHTYHLDPNTLDSDGETALFVAETVEAAQILVEGGVDVGIRNGEGETAEEKIEGEGEWGGVVGFLGGLRSGGEVDGGGGEGVGGGAVGGEAARRPPPLPENVRMRVGELVDEGDVGVVEDGGLRRRIEELASRENFGGEEAQRELRGVVVEAVRGVGAGEGREVRRRVE